MKILDHLEEWLIATLMAVATSVTFVAVVHRYASGIPILAIQDVLIQINTSWAQELTIYRRMLSLSEKTWRAAA